MQLPIIIVSVCLGILCIVSIVFLSVKLRKSLARQREIENLFHQFESKINNLELHSLESKLNPHLFKNILNTIQAHAYQTYFALDKLANVLDFVLYESQKKYVTPREEMEFALNLIEINKVKISPLFELKIKTKFNESEMLLDQPLVAPLISIDLIENAFKHADLQGADAFIAITFELKENVFYLTVANKISVKNPMKKPKSGIGTQTLEQRLKIIYSENYKLERFVEGDVHIAHLKINLFEHKAKMLAAR
jgi:LytS/YehU family sensor histidine kinase